jgi:hypothetical protein
LCDVAERDRRIAEGGSMSAVSSHPSVSRGNFYGTGVLGAIDHFIAKYGAAAAHAAVARLSPTARIYVAPNAPSLGILGARKYPYAFIGELMRAMMHVVHAKDEDAFIREMTAAGIDNTLNTVGRIVLKYIATPQLIAENAQRLWTTFHDSGMLRVTPLGDHEYVAEVTAWPNHDVIVCKVAAEARRRILERAGGKNVQVSRERCQAWGHDSCVFHVWWS